MEITASAALVASIAEIVSSICLTIQKPLNDLFEIKDFDFMSNKSRISTQFDDQVPISQVLCVSIKLMFIVKNKAEPKL